MANPTMFKVNLEDAEFVTAESLQAHATGILTAVGMRPDEAETTAKGLVAADLRGVESHGVSNMLKDYVDWIESGHMNPRPDVRVIRERASTASWDTDRGLGLSLGPRAMDVAIAKARDTGVGMVTMGNGRHIGMLAYTAMQAAEEGMIGLVMTAASPRVVPTFGRQPMFGTNPIAVAAPAREHAPFVFDAATSVIPGNKLTLAARLGQDLPPGVVAEPDGTPILTPTAPTPDVRERLLPLGSSYATGSHKGYGLACVTEIFSSLLSDTLHVARLGLSFANHFVAAMDVEAFVDRDSFLDAMDLFLGDLKSSEPAAGHGQVLVAGQPEAEYERTRRAEGVPLHPEVTGMLRELAERFGIADRLENAAGSTRR